jgi:hypothetical protein
MRIIGVMNMSVMRILTSRFTLLQMLRMGDELEEQMVYEEHGDEKMNTDISSDKYDNQENFLYFFTGRISLGFLVYSKWMTTSRIWSWFLQTPHQSPLRK